MSLRRGERSPCNHPTPLWILCNAYMHLLDLFVEPMVGNWILPEYNFEDNSLVNQGSDGYKAQ